VSKENGGPKQNDFLALRKNFKVDDIGSEAICVIPIDFAMGHNQKPGVPQVWPVVIQAMWVGRIF